MRNLRYPHRLALLFGCVAGVSGPACTVIKEQPAPTTTDHADADDGGTSSSPRGDASADSSSAGDLADAGASTTEVLSNDGSAAVNSSVAIDGGATVESSPAGDAGELPVDGAVSTASDAATCGNVSPEGACNGATLEYCEADQLLTLDCAIVGGTCQQTAQGAQCVEQTRAASCGDITALGTCDGDVIRYCDATGTIEVLREINCAAYGQSCDPDGADDGGAICVSYGACPAALDGNGACNDNQLTFCEQDELYSFDCGLDECQVVDGFADCFATSWTAGCGEETRAGRCVANVATRCLGGVVTTEDCAAVGLSCAEAADGAACAHVDCLATCPTGYSCASGMCAIDDEPQSDWTIAVYIVGDNNLSDNYWRDLKEMEAVGSNSAVKVVVQAEFSPLYSRQVPEIYRSGAYRGLVQAESDFYRSATFEHGLTVKDGINMSDPQALADFVRWTAENYPSKRMMLILSDHGGGYLGGFQDDGSRGLMRLRDITRGVSESGLHLDVIGFDACLMGMHEVGMAVRGVADVMVASEESEPATGYDYTAVLSALQQTPSLSPFELGDLIGSTYAAINVNSARIGGVTTATIDLSVLPALNEQLADLAETAISDSSTDRTKIQLAVGSSDITRFTDRSSADLRSLLSSLSGLEGPVGTAASDVNSWLATSGAVRSNYATGVLQGVGGLAAFLPQLSSGSGSSISLYTSETAFLPLQPWHAFARSLVATDPPPPKPGEGAVDWFSAVLTWGSAADNSTSNADLDIYVYEPSGEFGTPANGTTSGSGFLSGDSYDTEVAFESYELQPNHEAGTYIVLVHLYDSPPGEQAFPRLQIYRNDLPGGSRTLLRGKIEDRQLVEVPMDLSNELMQTISKDNIQGVFDLEYSNIWYATTIEVK